jgi:hypothetical protein
MADNVGTSSHLGSGSRGGNNTAVENLLIGRDKEVSQIFEDVNNIDSLSLLLAVD